MVVIGKHILESLTTGMYQDAKTIFREYVQNACDSIDKAKKIGLLPWNNEEFCVKIEIDLQKRHICIEDNAAGIAQAEFRSSLEDIANSDKKIGEEKGFRGIGRLCGLAYCKTLTFTASYKGEALESVMTLDAEKMRRLLYAQNKDTLQDVLAQIVSFKSRPADPASHFFRVELFEINHENDVLLDEKAIKNYLSFVAPLDYDSNFCYRTKIYDYIKEHGLKIDTYNIYLNDDELYKDYKTSIKPKKNSNAEPADIYDIVFQSFKDEQGNLLAWMWHGVSEFTGQIDADANPMAYLRLRQSNIQIGGSLTLDKLFCEKRFAPYLIGEVFAVSPDLIPNSQRDYFNGNTACIMLEEKLASYLADLVKNRIYNASRMRNYFEHIIKYYAAEDSLKKRKDVGFKSTEEKQKLEADLRKSENEKKKALQALKKQNGYTDIDFDSPLDKELFERLKSKYLPKLKPEDQNLINGIADSDSSNPAIAETISKPKEDKSAAAEAPESNETEEDAEPKAKREKIKYFTDDLSKLDKKQRKLVREIMTIMSKLVDKQKKLTAEEKRELNSKLEKAIFEKYR